MELDLDTELTPPQWAKVRHRWDWSWSGPQIKVKKLQPKYGSGAGLGSGVDLFPNIDLTWVLIGWLKTLDGSSCKNV